MPCASPRTSKRRATPRELAQAFADHVRRYMQFDRRRNRRRRVQHVVLARNIQLKFAQISRTRAQPETRLEIAGIPDFGGLIIGLRVPSVSDRPAPH